MCLQENEFTKFRNTWVLNFSFLLQPVSYIVLRDRCYPNVKDEKKYNKGLGKVRRLELNMTLPSRVRLCSEGLLKFCFDAKGNAELPRLDLHFFRFFFTVRCINYDFTYFECSHFKTTYFFNLFGANIFAVFLFCTNKTKVNKSKCF